MLYCMYVVVAEIELSYLLYQKCILESVLHEPGSQHLVATKVGSDCVDGNDQNIARV